VGSVNLPATVAPYAETDAMMVGDLGAAVYLLKPIRKATLLTALDQAMETST
jgi:hypothetical protein